MKVLLTVCLLIALYSCTPIVQSSTNSGSNQKILKLADATYEAEIRTVRLAPAGSPMLPAVASINQGGLVLEFDDLASDRDNYVARYIHCNYNWTQSGLQDLDFLGTYNEFPINDAAFSVDTHIPYVRYAFRLPPVKLPGNYVLVVYREGNKDDIVLTKRFMIFDQQVTFRRDDRLVGSGGVAQRNQQINFTVNYKNVNILNPAMDVHINMRQNQRWDNMITDVKSTFVREIEKEIEYKFFDDNQMFKGGNEFRFFDLRSINNPGRNVGFVNRKVKPLEIYLGKDKSRSTESYAQYNELNGNYIIQNYDFGGDINYSNYAYINFGLETPPIEGDVYVAGAFNNWNFNRENKMSYDSAQRMYTSRILLKQGWYDYQYYVRSSKLPTHHFEGSHFQTENDYEIFVYFRPFQPRADLLIGYLSFKENPRQ